MGEAASGARRRLGGPGSVHGPGCGDTGLGPGRCHEHRAEADRRADAERQAKEVEHQAKEQIASAQGQTQAALDLSESRLYFSHIARDHLSWRLGDWPESELALRQCFPTGAAVPDRRGWEWHYLVGRNYPELIHLTGGPEQPCQGLAYSPDGRLLLAATGWPMGLVGRDPSHSERGRPVGHRARREPAGQLDQESR